MTDAERATIDRIFGRIFGRAVELMVEHDDWPVTVCVVAAEFEDRIIYGTPGAGTPAGLINNPGLKVYREKR